uniref:Putative secreted protein n=1 Tax=Ixodes ricinus TaxID=34613 RepID=A0A6B0TRN5_IXORI
MTSLSFCWNASSILAVLSLMSCMNFSHSHCRCFLLSDKSSATLILSSASRILLHMLRATSRFPVRLQSF